MRRLALLLASVALSGCGHTEAFLRGATLERTVVVAEDRLSRGSSPRREVLADGSVELAAYEGDNGGTAWTTLCTLGLFAPGRLRYEAIVRPSGDGVAVAVRVSRWTQLLYLVPVIQRYEEREEELLRELARVTAPR